MSITEKTAKAIVEEFQAETDISQLCADHKLPLLSVCRVLVAAGEELPDDLEIPEGTRKGRHEERNQEIVKLHRAGFAYKALAEEYSLSDGRIGDICRSFAGMLL